jgi:hypothetical protein
VTSLWGLYLSRTQGVPDIGSDDFERFRAVAKRIGGRYDPDDACAAMVGMVSLFPYSKGERWDLFDLERNFTKAAAGAAARYPDPVARFWEEVEETYDAA